MSEQKLEPCRCGRAFAVIEAYFYAGSPKYAVLWFDKESDARTVWNSKRALAQAFANRDTLHARIEVLEAALVEIRDLAPAKTRYELSEMADRALKGEAKE